MPYTPEERTRYTNEYRAKRRREALDYLGGECVECGSTENLEFDHIDPATKVATIASLWTASKERFWTEVKKCQLLCHDHHVAKSLREGSWPGGDPPHPVKHTDAQVAEMVTMRAAGESLRAIAAAFGTTHRTVASRIKAWG